jgi:hypothetical protein
LQAAHDGEIWFWQATHVLLRWAVASI